MIQTSNAVGAELGNGSITKLNYDTNSSYRALHNLSKKNLLDLKSDCRAFMSDRRFPIDDIVIDGGYQRLSIDGGRDGDEWYIACSGISPKGNEWLICSFGTWSGGLQTWGSYKSWELDKNLPQEEKKLFEDEYKKFKVKLQEKQMEEEKERIEYARKAWDEAITIPTDPDHLTYLQKKKVADVNCDVRFSRAKINDGTKEKPVWEEYPTIAAPLFNVEDSLQAIQHIFPDGRKRIYGVKRGAFFIIGEIKDDNHVWIAEGLATALSVHSATKAAVIVVFDCGNFDPVLAALSQKYPNHKIFIAGDNDVEVEPSKQFPNGNPGRTKALEAAKKYKCEVVFPKFDESFKLPNGKRPTDWNDLHNHSGIDEVRDQLRNFQERRPRLITFNLNELVGKNIPPRKLVLKPWLPEGGASMIFAPTGVGKTYLCLSAAKAIASGGTLFNWEASERRKVLYVDAEMHESDLQARVKKLLGNSTVEDDYLRYLNGSWQADLFLPDLSTHEGQKLIEEIIDRYRIQVLFLDNLSTLCRTGKENETNSWIPMQTWLLKLRYKGISTVLVHHAGKAKDSNGNPMQRGTSMREVILESSLVLSHPKDYNEEQGCVFEVRYNKARNFWGADSASFEAKLIEKDGALIWEHQPLSLKTYDRVVDLYRQGITNPREIAKELEISRQAVNKHISRAKNEGEIS